MGLAQFPLWFLLAAALMCIPALAEPQASDFHGDWGEIPPAAKPGTARAAPLLGGEMRQAAPAPPIREGLDVGGSTVNFGTVEGAPGARVAPRSSNVTIGVGVAPATIGEDQESMAESFNSLDKGFAGALELQLSDGPLTPSMTVTGPLEGSGGGSEAGGEVRTMFGLGYQF